MLLILGPDRLFYRGPPVDGAHHRHHALQLALSLGAPLTLEAEAQAQAQAQESMGFVIAADTNHRLAGGAAEIALLYLEPESAAGQQLQQRLPQPAWAYQPSAGLQQAARDADAQFEALRTLWLAELGVASAETAPAAIDSRIADTLAHLAATTGQASSAATLAARVQLSPDRLMHLFAETTGTSLRSYALWAKLKTALRIALAGASLTEAAHAAGFADSAHLTHSFKAMFGLPPRFLFERREGLTVSFR